ncbi:MAG TPA: acyl-CoA dehydrogenase family protein, partial [Miltoncostaea sp.]|nr:acyl-CoA dehydrogenase family protein [Miltoncostaea sp.]
MPPQLNETQRHVQDLAREIAEREVAPRAAELNERHEIPRDAIRILGEAGLLGVTVPEEYGGPGLDAT